MMRLHTSLSLCFCFGLGFTWLGGCGSAPHLSLDLSQLGQVAPNDTEQNGINLQGINLQGINLQGINLQGINLQGTSLASDSTSAPQQTSPTPARVKVDLAYIAFDSLQLGTATVTGAQLNNSVLEGMSGRTLLSGSDLIGAEMTGYLLNRMSLRLKIEDVAVQNGITVYSIGVLSDTGLVPLCGQVGTSAVPAIAVRGYWDRSGSYVDDKTVFTFGCLNAAIGKCAIWGYQPWSTVQECRNNSCRMRDLKAWHTACTRMVRADYCGDGVAHTRSGTRINLYDQLGLQASDNPGWAIEAEWRMDGASCINHTRWVKSDLSWNETDLEYIQRACPSRLLGNGEHRCEPDKSTYNTQFGFNKDTEDRPLLRNESPQYQ